VLERLFKQNKQWGARDRKFVAETVYDVVRHYRLLSEISQSTTNFWFIISVYLVMKGVQLPDWQEFKHIDERHILNTAQRLKKEFAIFHSYPDDLNSLGELELGKEVWQEEAIAMNTAAEVVMRANTLKTSAVQLQTELRKEEIETQTLEEYPDAILLKKRANVFSWGSFKDGMFEIQDAGSQLIGYFTGVLPGQTVVDACAGAGGKSLHLAALMNNKGRIISMDVSAWKLEELEKRAKRASVSIIKTQIIESEKTIAALKEKADVLLLDVPCSGVGVLKRNPDAKWKFSNEVFNKTKQLQQTILNDYALMVKPGGTLVYSTCSIFPSENRNQVDLFLQKNINFELIKEKTVMPHEGFDGFYMCKILKKK